MRELDQHDPCQQHVAQAPAVHASLPSEAAKAEQRYVANAHSVLGASLARQGRAVEATRAHTAALEQCRQVLASDPGDDEVRGILANVLEDLAARKAETGEPDAGIALLEQALSAAARDEG